MVKSCYKCKRELPVSAFATSKSKKDGWQSQCKECQKIYRRAHYLANKQKYIDKAAQWDYELRAWWKKLKSQHQCSQCSETHPSCLEFHHLDPLTKTDSVSRLVMTGCKQKVLDEIKKCMVLCSNCHKKLHDQEPD